MARAYLRHLAAAKDLQTTREEVRAGFVALALEKNRRATPFVAEARALKAASERARKPVDLLKILAIQAGLLAAAGVSDKAATHLGESEKLDAKRGLIEAFLEPAGPDFVEELVFRFLLTRGDTLGGSMRNAGGFMAQKKLARAVIACMKLAGTHCTFLHPESKMWTTLPDQDADVELALAGLSWRSSRGPRTLLYNRTIPFLKNNVDLVLLNCDHNHLNQKTLKTTSAYVAVGELKGGIDPAGADEHWKTARSALLRLDQAFSKSKCTPHAFYIGASIERKMASEIWAMLRGRTLENAANLTDERQIASLAQWLCNL